MAPNDQQQVCGCWAMTIRVIGRSEAPFRNISSSSVQLVESAISISAILLIGEEVLQCWSQLQACPNSTAHMNPATMRFQAETIDRMLSLYGAAADHFLQTSDRQSGHPHDSIGCKASPAILGNLELDDDEAAVVGREALQYAITQLGGALQDVDKETRQHRAEGQPGALEARKLEELSTRLFHLLGRVGSLQSVPHL